MPVSSWSTTPASNNASPPNGAPEGMLPGSLNDVIRQIMADVRTFYNEVQKDTTKILGSVTGTNTIAANLTPAITAYTAGMHVVLIPTGNNTGAVTLAVNGLTALDVQKFDGDALVAGDLVTGVPAVLYLDSGADDWILVNPQTLTATAISTTAGAAIGTTLTVAGTSVNDCAILTTGTLPNARVAASNVTQHQAALSIASSQLTGSMPDARIQQSNVTQHQAALGAESATASTIARRNSSGYLYATYLNQSSPQNENPNFTQVIVESGSDGFLRKSSTAATIRQLMLSGGVTIQSDPGGTPSGSPGQLFLYY